MVRLGKPNTGLELVLVNLVRTCRAALHDIRLDAAVGVRVRMALGPEPVPDGRQIVAGPADVFAMGR